MTVLQVLIVDDEPLAQEILQHYVARTPGLELAGTCSNALEAFALLSRRPVDLLFLDVNMPELSGIELLRSLKHPPLTVFTTAYESFALMGYELDVVDYLLKPIAFERYLKAVQKARELLQRTAAENPAGIVAQEHLLFVKSEGKLIKIELTELWMAEGLKDYVRLWLGGSRIVVHSTMKGMEEQLSGRGSFIRISKSYIINMKYVSELDGNAIRINGQRISIGATYRDEVLGIFNRYKLL